MTSHLTSVEVYIENLLDTDTGFGSRVDNGEQVFINSRITRKFNVVEGQLRKFTVVPNDPSRTTQTPWRALGISMDDIVPQIDEPTPRVEVAKLEDRIMDHFAVEDNQYPHKASELADALGEEDLQMQMTLSRMHMTGEIAKAQVWAKGTQDKASFVLWAPSTDWFSA